MDTNCKVPVIADRMQIIDSFCSYPFDKIKISAEGLVHMCCHQRHDGYIGNLLHNTFEEIWFGEKAESIRKATREGHLHQICDTVECPLKYRNLKERTKGYLVNKNNYPSNVEFDLHPSHCNFGGLNPTPDTACFMCPRARPGYQVYLDNTPDKTMILVEKLKELIPHIRLLNILGVAEPFWKDKIFEIMDIIDFPKYKEHIEIWTTSNGSIFNEDRRNKFAEYVKYSEVSFSTDATTAQVYYNIRRHDVFETVCKNIKAWCTLKKELNSKGANHTVKLHNNINMLNVSQVPDMVYQAKDFGVDCLILLPTHDCGGTFEELLPVIVDKDNYMEFKEAQIKAIQISKEIGQPVWFSRPLDLGLGK